MQGLDLWWVPFHGYNLCYVISEMLEVPTKADDRETKVDPRLAEVVRIIVEDFGGDVRAFVDSIRPKAAPKQDGEWLERRLSELLAKS